jgi:hypothetical protein
MQSALPDWDAATHIWISHEHPDHFNVSTLKSIPISRRKEITVIFQKTKDKRVVEWFKRNGFMSVLEVNRYEKIVLSDGASISTIPFSGGDSLHMHICSNGFVILNLNDCFFNTEAQIKSVIKKLDTQHIDLLLAQFSYANWAFNPEEVVARKNLSDSKLENLRMLCSNMNPSYVLPFASYIYFCAQENCYLNDEINTMSKTQDVLRKLTCKVLVLLPNEELMLERNCEFLNLYNSSCASAAIDSELVRIKTGEIVKLDPPSVDRESLVSHVRDGLARLKRNVNPIDWHIMKLRLALCVFLVDDLQVIIRIQNLTLVESIPYKRGDVHDIVLKSDSLDYAFLNDFGFDSLLVNGRFREGRKMGGDVVKRLVGYFQLSQHKRSLFTRYFQRRMISLLHKC